LIDRLSLLVFGRTPFLEPEAATLLAVLGRFPELLVPFLALPHLPLGSAGCRLTAELPQHQLY
jgi:hypothetical protein